MVHSPWKRIVPPWVIFGVLVGIVIPLVIVVLMTVYWDYLIRYFG